MNQKQPIKAKITVSHCVNQSSEITFDNIFQKNRIPLQQPPTASIETTFSAHKHNSHDNNNISCLKCHYLNKKSLEIIRNH